MLGISYRRDDPSKAAFRLHDRLADQFGADEVFFDHESIPSGIDFVAYIHDALSQCKILLAVIGETWVGKSDASALSRLMQPNDYVRLELEFALSRNITVIPVLVDDTVFPDQSVLPETLWVLSKLNHFRLDSAEGFHASADRLLQQLQTYGIGKRSPYKSSAPQELRALEGDWCSYSHGGLDDIVRDHLRVRYNLGKLEIRNKANQTDYSYEAECRLIAGDFLSGEWWSTLPGSTAGGIFILKLSPHKDVAYGYYTGYTPEGSAKLLSWCISRSEIGIKKALKMLSTLVLKSPEPIDEI